MPRLNEYRVRESALQNVERALRDYDVALIGEHDPQSAVKRAFVLKGGNSIVLNIYTADAIQDVVARNKLLRDPRHSLLIGSRVSEKTRQLCRTLGINFADEDGNCYITFENVYIDVYKALRGESSAKTSSIGAGNLFTRRRSQVIFALLTWPTIANWSIREIAQVSGTSVGQAQATLKDLDYQGFLIRDSGEILQANELFQLWLLNYPSGLMRGLESDEFAGEFSTFDPAREGVLLSGESAVSTLIKPASMLLYVSELSPQMILRNRWSRSGRPNIFIRKKFWKHPSEVRATLANRSDDAELDSTFAPTTLIYADLIASGDSRQREAAENLKDMNERLFRLTSQ